MTNDNVFREVDEELRRDRMRKAWRTFGPWVIGGAVAIVVGYAAYQGWVWYQKNATSTASDQFYSAMTLADGSDRAAAQAALDEVVAKGGGYASLAKFRLAALLAQDGKVDEAVAAYDALAATETSTQLKQVATVQAAYLLIDKGNVADTQQRLQSIFDTNAPLSAAAQEILGLTQYKAGLYDDAIATFTALMSSGAQDQALLSRVSVYTFQALSAGGKMPAPPVEVSEEEAPVTDETSVGVDASTELDVVPPSAETSSVSEASSSPQ